MYRIQPDQAAQAMIDAARFFHQQGWLLGTCGNLSVKLDGETLLASPSGRDKGRLEPGDFLRVTKASSAGASAEIGVHKEIYRLTSARAVYHVHSISNNLAGALWREQGAVEFAEVEMIKGLTGKTLYDRVRLPIVANSNSMEDLANNVAQGLSTDVPGVLVDRHGLYAWGNTTEEARRHVEIIEFLLEYAVRWHEMGGRR